MKDGNDNGNGDNGHPTFHFWEMTRELFDENESDLERDRVMEEYHLDCRGRKRLFRLQEYGRGPASFLSATEIRDGKALGLRFVMRYDESTEVPPYGEIRDKISDRLAIRHVVRDPKTNRWTNLNLVIRAQIGESDEEVTPGPDLVVDDTEITWEELGTMLRPYAGWGLRIRITDVGAE